MPSHQEHPCEYQQDEGASGRSGPAKRHRCSDQRHYPGTGPHYREAEDQAQPRHVYHRLVDCFLRRCRESLSVAQGVPCADARRRVVGAEEDGEDAYGPAAHAHRSPFQTFGEQVDGQGHEPEKGNLDDVEPHEPPPYLYRVGDIAGPRMEDLQDGEGQRGPEQDDPAQYQTHYVTPPSSRQGSRVTSLAALSMMPPPIRV